MRGSSPLPAQYLEASATILQTTLLSPAHRATVRDFVKNLIQVKSSHSCNVFSYQSGVLLATGGKFCDMTCFQ